MFSQKMLNLPRSVDMHARLESRESLVPFVKVCCGLQLDFSLLQTNIPVWRWTWQHIIRFRARVSTCFHS